MTVDGATQIYKQFITNYFSFSFFDMKVLKVKCSFLC